MAKRVKKVIDEELVVEEDVKGFGDKVEEVIKKVAPKLAEKYGNCKGCKKRKVWMNRNINGNFK